MREDEMTEGIRVSAISTPDAPAALGPYAQARVVAAGNVEWIYTSGQVGIDPGTGELAEGGTAGQVEQVLNNLRAVLATAGCDFADVVKTTIFLVDLSEFQLVNKAYGEALGDALPARSTVQVSRLPKDARIEIEMVAVRSPS
jgi:2-iminobutanoate/2-iminopropanoate deaminase